MSQFRVIMQRSRSGKSVEGLTPEERKIERIFRGNELLMSFDLVKFRELLEGHPIEQEEPAHQEPLDLDSLAADALIRYLKSRFIDNNENYCRAVFGPLVARHDKKARKLLVSPRILVAFSPLLQDLYA